MKIVFITPTPKFKRNALYRFGGKLYGHSNAITGPLILGTICKQAGYEVEAYEELNGKVPYQDLLRTADVLCLYTMTSTAPRAYELADWFHREGHARVLIGGMHASEMPQEALRHADQVLVGEGEDTILDVIEGRRPEPIVVCSPVNDLDAVPFPDYSILKTPCVAANIMTSRGCPYRCTFCSTSRMFSPYRKRSVDSVIEEIRLYHDMGFQYMNFEDDNFTADKERAKEICRRIIAENLQFKETFFFGRTDLADDEEMLSLLSQAHLSRVLIGIESLNQKALDAIHKGQDIDDIKRAAAACKRHGIRVIASLVLGLDEDTHEDIQRTVDFACSIDAYQLQPAILTPYPHTPVYQQMVADGRMITDKWDRFDMTHVVFQPKNMTPWELQVEFFDACHQFYTFRSAVRIGRIFGAEYGWRRFYLALAASLGPKAAYIAADHAERTYFYELKHNLFKTGMLQGDDEFRPVNREEAEEEEEEVYCSLRRKAS